MASTEIAVSIIAGLFALYGLLITLGSFYDRRKFTHRIEEADKRATLERGNSSYFSRKVAHLAETLARVQKTSKLMSRGWYILDQGVGRAIARIINQHSEEHSLRLATDPDSYLPDAGKQHEFIARGMARALNIIEDETTRYKAEEEEEEEPSPAYVAAKERYGAKCVVCGGRATTHRWGQLQVELVPVPYRAKVTVRLGKYDYWQTMKPLNLCQTDADVLDRTPGGMVVFYVGAVACTHEEQIAANRKRELGRRQRQEADNRRRQFVANQRQRQATIDQRRRISEDNTLLCHQHQQPTAPYPTAPPPGGCKVCGSGAYTYRWGQCLTTWHSVNNKETTWATVEWQKYDSNFDVGYFPVCAHHARVLDKHGTVTRETNGRPRRTGGTPPMPGSPPILGTKCATCRLSPATTHIWGYRATYVSLRIFQSQAYSGGGNGEWLPVCEASKRAFDREGYVVLSGGGC